MTDASAAGSVGIIGWQIGADGVAATNDTGAVIVPVDSFYLTQEPYDLAVDSNGFIYTIQFLTLDEYPAYDLMSFPPYDWEPETTVVGRSRCTRRFCVLMVSPWIPPPLLLPSPS